MLGPTDPGPDYAVKFLEEFLFKNSQGFIVKVEEVLENALPTIHIFLYVSRFVFKESF